jgi:hypothetical protein
MSSMGSSSGLFIVAACEDRQWHYSFCRLRSRMFKDAYCSAEPWREKVMREDNFLSIRKPASSNAKMDMPLRLAERSPQDR